MALIQCPECGSQVSDKALSCPRCGYPMSPAEKPRKSPKTSAKRHPKLPNGFGSIKKLSGNRTNPYAVYPPVTEFDLNGNPVQPKALAYVDNWYKAFGVLSAWKGGNFKPGDTIEFDDSQITDAFVLDIISAFNYGISSRKSQTDLTFSEVFQKFIKWEIGQPLERENDVTKIRKLKTRRDYLNAAYKNCSSLHNQIFRTLTYDNLQDVVDSCPLKHASKEHIITLYHKMYKYAKLSDITERNVSEYVTIKTEDDDESGVPFTTAELKTLWEHKEDPTIEFILIMCFSGFRISAYKSMKVDLENRTFFGGIKTKNGIDRIVPIHPAIFDMVDNRIKTHGKLLFQPIEKYRSNMYEKLEELGIEKHTPHDCRDTFATLCDKFKVDKNYLKRLIGHSLSSDITEDKYIHPELDDLRKEIEKIDLSRIVTNDPV